MRLIANRQLTGDHGFVLEGQVFETDTDEKGRSLINRGLARAADPPKVLYSTKVIVPEAPEVSARQPFRHVPVPHKESQAVVTESDQVFSGPDVPEQGTADTRGRAGRKGSGAK